MANYAKNPVTPRPAVDYAAVHGAQAKMIMLLPEYLDEFAD
jgi:hypothetical protein